MANERGLAADVGVVTLLAFGVRLAWVTWVQSPCDVVHSDMLRYLALAARFLDLGWLGPRDAEAVLFPYGVASWYALVLRIAGPDAATLQALAAHRFVGLDAPLVAALQAATGALVTTFTMMTAHEVPLRRGTAIAVGILTAVWWPAVTFVGYFSSEVPYSVAVALALWSWARFARTGKGAILAGAAIAVGLTFRPPILLAGILGLGWLVLRRLPQIRLRSLALLALPIVCAVTFSAWRFHALTGRWAVVSDNGAIARFFAVTDYRTLTAVRGRSFTPPARLERLGFEGVFEVDGWIADAAPLDAERERVWEGMTVPERLAVLQRNVGLLAVGNPLWPERSAVAHAEMYARDRKERSLLDAGVPKAERDQILATGDERRERRANRKAAWRVEALPWLEGIVVYGLLPLSGLGLLRLMLRVSLGLEIAALHLLTMVYAAAVYFGEVRYRVPYDPALLLLAGFAIEGLWTTPERRGVYTRLRAFTSR